VCGAGSEVRPSGKNETTKFSLSTPGFAAISATRTDLTIQFLNTKNNILYSADLKK